MDKVRAIRGIDEEIFRKFRARTIEERMKLGEALTMAMRDWLEKERKNTQPNPRNLLKIEGFIKTKGKVKWSEEIDEILYGEGK